MLGLYCLGFDWFVWVDSCYDLRELGWVFYGSYTFGLVTEWLCGNVGVDFVFGVLLICLASCGLVVLCGLLW